MRRRSKRRDRLINLAVALAATLLSYAALEMLVWRPNLQKLPLALHQQLGFLDILAQPSKKASLPEPGYVALIGDSYAEGLGDWLMQVVYDGNPDFNTGHLLYRKTGRDVLNFGYRGGQPAWTFTYEMTAALHGINRYDGIELPPAGDVVAFFYEGNDVNDLMEVINFGMPAWADPARLAEPETARRYVAERAAEGRKRAYRRWHPLANAHMAGTAGHLIKLAGKNFSRNGGNLLAGEDPSFRKASAGYHEDWARYQQSVDFIRAGGRRLPYPSPTVESFVFHSPEELALAGTYVEASLEHLKTLFPGARLWLAYIPSPVNVYDLDQPDIGLRDRIRLADHREDAGPAVRIPAATLVAASDATCRAIEPGARRQGFRLLDTRPALRAAARRDGYLHGPSDPGHFNRKGYEAFADILAESLKSDQAGGCRTP